MPVRALRRSICVAVLASWAGCVAAQADDPAQYRFGRGHILVATDAEPLGRGGEDAIRFSMTPALGGIARVVEVRAGGRSPVVTVREFRGHPQLGWNPVESRRSAITKAQYQTLAAEVDRQLERAATYIDDRFICTDGPGFVTERRVNGRDQRYAGFCGEDHPNGAIHRLIHALIARPR